MIDSYFRDPYQTHIVNPLLKLFDRFFTPTFFTFLGLVFGIGIFISLFFSNIWSAILFLLASGFCDTIDGSLARFQNKTTSIGAALDIIFDRIVEFLTILGLYFVFPQERALLCLLMLGSILVCVTSFLVVGIFKENNSVKSFYYHPGIIERTEAFLFFAAMILFPNIFWILATVFTLLVTLTAMMRILEFSHTSYALKE